MKTIAVMLMVVGIATVAGAGAIGDAVEVRIRNDSGKELPLYPVAARTADRRAYLEAVKGEQYSILVRNRLNRRVGVVVAVDGRNIISGEKSRLKSTERMYILEPYGEGEYSGWRANLERINRFYFTDVADSYAAAFRDESAMGVIAVAVYPEIQRHEPPAELSRSSPPAPSPMHRESMKSRAADQGASPSARMEGAGTGYGRDEYSPARTVAFNPERRAVERIFLKYEWHATLCRKGVIECGIPAPLPRNRFWDDGFAPPPPGR
jgi:hypothetical protein